MRLLQLFPLLLLSRTAFAAEGETSDHASDHASDHTSDHTSHHTSHHTSDHASDHDEPSVFALGEYFDYDTFVVLVSIVGGCAIVIELALSKYEQWLKSEGDTFQSTLYEKIVRELMTLGVVSFALYLLHPVVEKGDLFLVFEFSHYVIFFIAIFTVLQLVMLGASTYPIKRRWDIAAYKSKEELLEGYRAMIARTHKWSIPMFGLGRVSLDVFHWGSNWKWIDAVQYHLARSVFIRQHRQNANFDFARYACLVTDRQILGMANVSLISWLALLVFRWVSYGLQVGLSRDGGTVSFRAWFVFGIVLCLLELSLLFACMLGVRRVCTKLGADPQDPVKTVDAVLERIWVAPMTHVQHAASMHGIVRPALGEGATSDTPRNSCAVDADQAAVVHGSEGGGELEAGGSAVRSTMADCAEEMPMRGMNIPEITMRDAFVLPIGKAYKQAVEILMLLNSYYLAFYAVYFISRASKSETEWVWIIVLPLPILAGVLMAYRRVLPLIALLSTIVMMQPTDVADVEQEAEELNKLRRKLVMRVEDVLEQEFKACAESGETRADGETSAAFLLKRWDEDDNGNLSYQELHKGLEEIGLLLSSKQRRELIRLADPDRSGGVDIKELTELLYDVEVEIAAGRSIEREEQAAAAAPGRMGLTTSLSTKVGFRRTGSGLRPNGLSAGGVNDRVERLLRKRASEKWS